ncbi:MAG TPA: FmdB family zinc ribbon protein [Candidatus Azoamicus sp.]
MPIYEYVCFKCNYKVEKLHKINEICNEKCPTCDDILKKKISASHFKLKGTGWYETDFKKKK